MVEKGCLAGTDDSAAGSLTRPGAARAGARRRTTSFRSWSSSSTLTSLSRCRSIPTTRTGRRLAGDNGKTETWVIIDAEPGSLIYAGLKAGVGERELTEAIQTKTVEHLLHRFEPKPGDCILIEAGTVHAIGAGVLLAEIQEMSDATFRIDDWGRLGDDGKPRPLHISQSMESIDFEPRAGRPDQTRG